MRLKIQHQTTYRYANKARSAIQLMRLTPRSTESQFVRKWRVSLDADARLDRSEDAFGNITHLAYIDGAFTELVITVEGEVDTTDGGGFVRGSVERQPERLFLRETALTMTTPDIRDLAREAIASEGGDKLAGLHRINAGLNTGMRFDTGATTSTTTAGAAYLAKAGVCQDFAHIFIVAARAIGIPARYVSGYYLRTDRSEQDAGHAWAEAHLPGLGWIAFDPAQGMCATERHVRVAVGGDSNEAAPIRGTRAGGEGEMLAVAISVAEGKPGVQARPVQRQGQQSQNQ